MNKIQRGVTLLILGLVGATASYAQVLTKGTDVDLKFAQTLNSKTAHVGDMVRFKVASDVVVSGKNVLHEGTPVTGVIEKVDKRGKFGKNARIRIAINPIHTRGGTIELQPRDKQSITGRRSDTAAAASGGGALLLGPVGLVGGYFVVGKPVKVQVGDPLYTEVSRTVRLHG
jgi:hypothetical protein